MSVKRPKLSIATMKAIFKKKRDNPDLSYSRLAELFNCSYDQARMACINSSKGLYNRTSRVKPKKTEEIMKEETAEQTFKSQFEYALAALKSDIQISPLDRISALEKISKIRKTVQTMNIESHLKGADAELVAAIIRRYQPEADDDTIIKVIREELEKLKVRDGSV